MNNTSSLMTYIPTNDILSLIDSSYDGIIISDTERYIYVNDAYEKITGISKNEIIGRSIQELIQEGVIKNPISVEVMKSDCIKSQWRKVRNKELLFTGTPVYGSDNKIQYIVTNVRDLTDLVSIRKNIFYYKTVKKIPKDIDLENKIIMKSPLFKKTIEQSLKVAKSDSAILLLGESGVGKGLLAEYIHNRSFRSDGPFITVNCGAISSELIESELFGYVPGAFTGANRKGKKGYFNEANGGTIFLDEIGELSLELQVKLLNALQDKKITPVGGSKPIDVDVRVISATNRNLEEMVSKGTFRLDLYYRINVISINIPPLRERKEDIPEIINQKLVELNSLYGTNKVINKSTINQLMEYSWPGNIRELKNTVERLFILDEVDLLGENNIIVGRNIENAELDARELKSITTERDIILNEDSLEEMVNEFEKSLIINALRTTRSQKEAAKLLKIKESTLSRKIKRLNINTKYY